MPRLTAIPFANDDGDITPLSFLQAAMKEPGMPENARGYIQLAIGLLDKGAGLQQVCSHSSQHVGLEKGLQEAKRALAVDEENGNVPVIDR